MSSDRTKPNFTIVTLSYNQRPYLRRAIESVLGERAAGIEYTIVDPGSTDGSRELIQEYRADIDHVILEPDDGPAHGLQKAFRFAAGRYYGCINADDALLKGALTPILAAFEANPQADAVLSEGYKIDAEGNPTGLVIPTAITPRRYILGIAEFLQQGTFVRAEAYHRVGGYNVENRVSWDGEFFLRLAMSGSHFVRITDRCAVFTLHAEGITGSGRLSDLYRREHARMFEEVVGRPLTASDHAVMRVARVYKHIAQPSLTAKKLAYGFRSRPVSLQMPRLQP